MRNKAYKSVSTKFSFVLLICALFLSSCISQNETQIRENFQLVVDEMNQSTPMQIDKFTVLEKLSLGEGLHIKYHYILDQNEIIAENELPKQVAEKMYDVVLPIICTNKDTMPGLEAGAIFEYIFNNQSNEELARFNITHDNCELIMQ